MRYPIARQPRLARRPAPWAALVAAGWMIAFAGAGCMRDSDAPTAGDGGDGGPSRPVDSLPGDSLPRDTLPPLPSQTAWEAAPALGLEPFVGAEEGGLRKPVWFGAVPGMPGAFLALEQHSGRIVALVRGDSGWLREDFLALSVSQERECGLLGLAFHPAFAENGRYFVAYNPASGPLATVVEERVADGTRLKDSGRSGRQILRVPQEHIIHKGGDLAFGPRDGFLYVGLGDGGDVAPAQDLGDLKGKMLRLDVDRQDPGKPYAVPPDNPYAGHAGARPEIWASGLRNPWRWSFDPATGELWAGDVGEEAREEITLVPRGANLGWPLREGLGCRRESPGCAAAAGALDPVLDFGRDRGRSVIGGVVWRGDPSSPWYGTYFFADYFHRGIRALRTARDAPARWREAADSPLGMVAFALGGEGTVYAVGHEDGVIYRLTGLGPP